MRSRPVSPGRYTSPMPPFLEPATGRIRAPRPWSVVAPEQLLLPRQQHVHAIIALGCDAFERRPRRDQVRVDGQLCRGPIPPLLERGDTLVLVFREALSRLGRDSARPLGSIELQRIVRGTLEAGATNAAYAARRYRLSSIETPRGVDEMLVRQDVKRRPVDGASLVLTPMPQSAKHGARARPERVAAAHAPLGQRVALPNDARGCHGSPARLLQPREPPEHLEPPLKQLSERQQKVGVVARVLGDLRRQRSARPVGLLRALG